MPPCGSCWQGKINDNGKCFISAFSGLEPMWSPACHRANEAPLWAVMARDWVKTDDLIYPQSLALFQPLNNIYYLNKSKPSPPPKKVSNIEKGCPYSPTNISRWSFACAHAQQPLWQPILSAAPIIRRPPPLHNNNILKHRAPPPDSAFDYSTLKPCNDASVSSIPLYIKIQEGGGLRGTRIGRWRVWTLFPLRSPQTPLSLPLLRPLSHILLNFWQWIIKGMLIGWVM